jgi:hypothetical protein
MSFLNSCRIEIESKKAPVNGRGFLFTNKAPS